MRYQTNILWVILIILLCSVTTINKSIVNNDFCLIFKDVDQLTKHNFVFSDHDKVDTNQLKQIDNITFQNLNGYDKSFGERNFIYGKFPISKNRLGLICYNKVRESDDNAFYFSLYIIDDCTTKRDFKILTLDNHHSGILYQWKSSFNNDFSQLTMTLKQTSEWVVGSDLKTDTLFTDIYCINLKSANLDTLSATKSFKIIKRI